MASILEADGALKISCSSRLHSTNRGGSSSLSISSPNLKGKVSGEPGLASVSPVRVSARTVKEMAFSAVHSATLQSAAALASSHSALSASPAAAASSSLLPPVSRGFCSRQLTSRRDSSVRAPWRPLHVAAIAAGPAKSPAETEWRTKREALLKNKVRSVRAKEAFRLTQEQGYTLLDVRPEGAFAQSHPEGAVNVQVYRLIKEWTAWDIARRAAFAFFGIFEGTEENPDFVKEVNAKLGKDAKIIVVCASGGTLKPSPNLTDGVQSRSLIAAYLLTLDGYTNILHLDNGLRTWFEEDLPVFPKEE